MSRIHVPVPKNALVRQHRNGVCRVDGTAFDCTQGIREKDRCAGLAVNNAVFSLVMFRDNYYRPWCLTTNRTMMIMRNVFFLLGLSLTYCALTAIAQDSFDAFKPIDDSAPKTTFEPTPAPTEQALPANAVDSGFSASSFDVVPKKPQPLSADGVSDIRRAAPSNNVNLSDLDSLNTAAPAVAEPNPATAKQFTDIPRPQRHGHGSRIEAAAGAKARSLTETAGAEARSLTAEAASLTMPSALPTAVINTAANDYQHLSSQPSGHPLARYLVVANDVSSKIAGKPMQVAELLNGVRSASARSKLLQAYWELSGKLAEYNIQRESNAAASRIAELEFVKAQWKLAEIIKHYKNIDFNENDLPIPADYPLYQGYETYAQQIARTDRTEYLARVLPVQEQLIGAKLQMSGTADALLDVVKAIVEYNCMIAEYASTTVSPNADIETMVGAVIKLPKRDNPRQTIRQTSYQQDRACVTGCSNANYIIR
jgi:hypothetical protein